jgi:hypothetical protein
MVTADRGFARFPGVRSFDPSFVEFSLARRAAVARSADAEVAGDEHALDLAGAFADL